ncbi:hypothetical protein AMATHDRAFT_56869 [Amanita thiersii Skay4041]|uniref:Protein CMS1 n=1 Tax=Amanita thiersii Skay4041 TaxID=703135 RepID=A0A2A9NVN7_9AGAR|nr:hypothetical protein AMATHDRAFT_56869 [Amanita thiersii Skay4041]
MYHGDDLDDNFVVDNNLTALSENEDNEFALLSDQEPSDDSLDASPLVSLPPSFNEKKRKRRAKEKDRRAKRRKLQGDSESIELSIANQSPHDSSIYLSSLQEKSFSKLSSLELEDVIIPEIAIADTSIWPNLRTLDNLVDFIMKVLPTLHTRLGQKSKNNGSPTLLFVAGAALRVVDITRALKDKRLRGEKGGEVAKLFAKHFKLSEHVAYLKRTKIGAAVGTPGRIGKLLCDTDALSVSALSHIILDVTHRDAKKRNLLDITETRDEVFRSVLGAPQILRGMKDGKIKLVLF